MVRTVLGDVMPDQLGVTLAHEHLIIDSTLVAEEMSEIHLPSVDEATAEAIECHRIGVGAMVDAMPWGSGGDPVRLREISAASGIRIVASTGMHALRYYRDAPWAHEESAGQLAGRFTAMVEVGIEGICAGVLKVATTQEHPTPQEARLLEAASATHLTTGVPILTHCQDGKGGMAQIEALARLGVDPGRVALSHTDKVADIGYHRDLMGTGALLCYDQGLRTPEQTALLIAEMAASGFVPQILVGTDGARRSLWATLGGEPGLAWINTGFRELLLSNGLAEVQVEEIFVSNPSRWLSFSGGGG